MAPKCHQIHNFKIHLHVQRKADMVQWRLYYFWPRWMKRYFCWRLVTFSLCHLNWHILSPLKIQSHTMICIVNYISVQNVIYISQIRFCPTLKSLRTVGGKLNWACWWMGQTNIRLPGDKCETKSQHSFNSEQFCNLNDVTNFLLCQTTMFY